MTILKQNSNGVGYEIVENDGEEPVEREDLLSGVLDELGIDGSGDVLLKVYHVNEYGKDAHCFDCTPDGLNGIEDRLRAAYGKGDYKIKIFTPTPQGRKSCKSTVKLSLEVPNEEHVAKEINNDGTNIRDMMNTMLAATQANTTNMLQMFRESQLESQNKTQELLISVLTNKKDDSPSIVEQLALLKQLMPEQPDAMVMLNSMMDMHSKVKEEFNDDAPPSGSLESMTNALGSLVELAKESKIPSDQSIAETGSKNKQEPEQDMNILIKMKLRKHISMLCTKAKENKNPSLWAELTVDEIPEEYNDKLFEMIGKNNESGMKNLFLLSPETAQYEEWFCEFLNTIRDMYIIDEKESGETVNESSDESNNLTVVGKTCEDDIHVNSTQPNNTE